MFFFFSFFHFRLVILNAVVWTSGESVSAAPFEMFCLRIFQSRLSFSLLLLPPLAATVTLAPIVHLHFQFLRFGQKFGLGLLASLGLLLGLLGGRGLLLLAALALLLLV